MRAPRSPLARLRSLTASALVAGAVAVTAVAAGCSDKAAPAAEAPPPPPPTVAGALGEALGAYEELRAALADDQQAPVAALAARLKTAGEAMAQEELPGAADVVKGAEGLAAEGATMAQLRVAYGELSRGVVAALVARPDAQRGRHLFTCPMAKGYQQWVQLSPKMANPYMGKRMLECGSAVNPWAV